ncbi:MAG: hypothetical protein ACM3NQ_13475 [Bacteroidales bacterium]
MKQNWSVIGAACPPPLAGRVASMHAAARAAGTCLLASRACAPARDASARQDVTA